MADNNSVCAVVVTYNRKDLLLECLEALLKQTRPIQGMYIIDNFSTDGTPNVLLEKGYIFELPPDKLTEPWEREFEIKNLTDGSHIKVHYVRMHENTGGAGGFYEGVKRGYEKGYDWLWLMDDDAEPKEDALEKLSFYFEKENIVALAGTVVNKEGNICYNHRGTINFEKFYPMIQTPLDDSLYKNTSVEIDMASFVGLLVNNVAIRKIGYPKKEFFIHHDDVEYCIRLHTTGKIFLIPASIILHKEVSKNIEPKRILLRNSFRIPFDKLWLSYYGKRNLIWLGKEYTKNKFTYYLNIFLPLPKIFLGILLYDDFKLKRINFIVNLIFDGLKGNFDNQKPKKILYKN